jgi:hypothetical protein
MMVRSSAAVPQYIGRQIGTNSGLDRESQNAIGGEIRIGHFRLPRLIGD